MTLIAGESAKREAALFGNRQVSFNILIANPKTLPIDHRNDCTLNNPKKTITMPGLFTPRNVAIGGAAAGAVLYFWPKSKPYVFEETDER